MTIRKLIASLLLVCTVVGLWGAIDHGITTAQLALAITASAWNLYWAYFIYRMKPRVNPQGS